MSAGLPLRVSGLSKDYGRGPVLADLSFSVPAGETLSVIGPSGCGKSTLLALLAGLDKPDEGTALVGAASAALGPNTDGRVAFILQDYGLFPWKTVVDNLALPLELRGVPAPERQRRCTAMLDELKLTGLERRFPSQLSGGQRQRVAIGRALITEPDVLLMDEPFSSLDALTREHLQNTVLALWQRHRPTCVLVTHNVAEAVFLGMHVMVLNGRPASKTLWLDNPCFGNSDCPDVLTLTRRIYAALRVGGSDDMNSGIKTDEEASGKVWGEEA